MQKRIRALLERLDLLEILDRTNTLTNLWAFTVGELHDEYLDLLEMDRKGSPDTKFVAINIHQRIKTVMAYDLWDMHKHDFEFEEAWGMMIKMLDGSLAISKRTH